MKQSLVNLLHLVINPMNKSKYFIMHDIVGDMRYIFYTKKDCHQKAKEEKIQYYTISKLHTSKNNKSNPMNVFIKNIRAWWILLKDPQYWQREYSEFWDSLSEQ